MIQATPVLVLALILLVLPRPLGLETVAESGQLHAGLLHRRGRRRDAHKTYQSCRDDEETDPPFAQLIHLLLLPLG